MQLIGAGLGRTGTLSLKVALESLGFRPCYHMLEVFRHPGHIKTWLAAAKGEAVDWEAFLGRYKAGLDYPLSVYYKELIAAFPNAKVILTTRDPIRWYESTYETIYQGAVFPAWLLQVIPSFRGFTEMVRATVWDGLFGGQFEKRDRAIRVFEEHIAEVKRTVSPEKLLVFSVREGWDPLCAFLGVPVPDKPFPHINDRRTTKRLFFLTRLVAAMLTIGIIGLLAWLLRAIY